MDRRRVLRAGLMALGGAALAGLAGGCSLLGIENPNATANQETTDPGFLELEGSIVQKPGSQSDRIVLLPLEWVVDGVEVFNGESASNKKRLNARVDASYITQSKTFEGHSLIRRVDEEKSSVRGYEVLADTNNSSNDFYESEKQSLRD